MIYREELESLALLCSSFNIQLQFNLGRLGNLLNVGFPFLLTINLIMYILTLRYEICGATNNQFCQIYHEASRRESWHGMKPRQLVIRRSVLQLLQRVLPEQQIGSSSVFQSCLTRSHQTSLSLSLDLSQYNRGVFEAVIRY